MHHLSDDLWERASILFHTLFGLVLALCHWVPKWIGCGLNKWKNFCRSGWRKSVQVARQRDKAQQRKKKDVRGEIIPPVSLGLDCWPTQQRIFILLQAISAFTMQPSRISTSVNCLSTICIFSIAINIFFFLCMWKVQGWTPSLGETTIEGIHWHWGNTDRAITWAHTGHHQGWSRTGGACCDGYTSSPEWPYKSSQAGTTS